MLFTTTATVTSQGNESSFVNALTAKEQKNPRLVQRAAIHCGHIRTALQPLKFTRAEKDFGVNL